MASLNNLISQLKDLRISEDDPMRRELKDALDKARVQLEDPKETLLRTMNLHLQLALLRVGVELGLFKLLVSYRGRSVSTAVLAEKTASSPGLIGRILRFLSAAYIVEETGVDQFRASKLTHFFASVGGEGVILLAFDVSGPAVQDLPAFLKQHNYTELDSTLTPFNKAHNTDLPCYEWLSLHPVLMNGVQGVMTGLRCWDWMNNFKTLDDAVASYLADEVSSTNLGQAVERPFFVDVGGGHGHQGKQLLEKYPALAQIHGSMVLEDLPQSVDGLQLDGITVMAHDFFNKQPFIGGRIYYLSRILHDWDTENCHKILGNLVEAMAPDSMIMLDEWILPRIGVPWAAAFSDVHRMTVFGTRERTLLEWEETVKGVGLMIKEVYMYDESTSSGIMVLVKRM